MPRPVSYLPARLVPGIENIRFEDVSLYNVPGSRYDLHAVSATKRSSPLSSTASRRGSCGFPSALRALAARRLTLLPEGQPLEYAESVMRGDRYKVVLDLVRQP
ncbi:hypothetical protein BH23ACI1_BH23ACI1_23340 [soil metagenome]